MTLKRLIFFTLLTTLPLNAAFEARLPGARFMALGFSGRAMAHTPFALFANPAALHSSGPLSLDVFYRTFYGVEGLNRIALQGTFKALGFTQGVAINRFGNNLYNENDIAWGAAYRWRENLHAGMALHMYHLAIERYGSAQAYSFSLALQYTPVPQLSMALHADNLLRPQLGQSGERVPLQAALAFSYGPQPQIALNADLFKDERHDFSYHIGFSFEALEQLRLLAGLRSNDIFSAGATYIYGPFGLNYAVELHPVLNISHGLGFTYVF